jgi:predicted enzyme related to lactoylglutathione lyase
MKLVASLLLGTVLAQVTRSSASDPNLPSKISMILLEVSDVARAAAFYRDMLGLQLKNQTQDIAFVEAGGVTLVLRKRLWRANESHSCAMEIVFPVQSVRTARGLLEQRGGKFINEPHEVTSGSWASTLTDPDGHNITVFGQE